MTTKLAAVSLATLLVVAVMVAPVAAGSDVTEAGNTLAVSDATAPTGATVTLSVTVDYANLSSYDLGLRYDPSVLRVLNVTGGNHTDPVATYGDGWINLSESNVTALDDRTLARVTVELVGPENATTNVTFASGSTTLTGPDGQSLPVEGVEPGHIAIGPVAETPGGGGGNGTATAQPGTATADGSDESGGSGESGEAGSGTGGATPAAGTGGSGNPSGDDSSSDDGVLPALPDLPGPPGLGWLPGLPGGNLLVVLAVLFVGLGGAVGVALVRRRRSRASKLDW